MTLQISVRGHAMSTYPAERATVQLAAVFEGGDRERVFSDAVALADPLAKELQELVAAGAVSTWSAEQLRVHSHRPWLGDGKRGKLLHTARISVGADFTDFEQLSSWLNLWGGREGLEVGSISWDVTVCNRRRYESEVRRKAVDDAVSRAQTYADAVGRGEVIATKLADPGLLDGRGSEPEQVVRFAGASRSAGPAPELDLTPGNIEIEVEVDARFNAD